MVETRERIPIELDGLSETLLWSLHHRVTEARRPDAVIADPEAIRLVERIDYPFAERFGTNPGRLAQSHALRSLAFDREVGRLIAATPGATVVALGAGLETRFWRIDDGHAEWISLDLPHVALLREQLLPTGPGQRVIGRSVLDPDWLDALGELHAPIFTAEGLLMYLRPVEVHELLARIGRRHPSATLVFDAASPSMSARTIRESMEKHDHYVSPEMPWSVPARKVAELRAAIPSIEEVRPLPFVPGRGLFHGQVLPELGHLAVVRDRLPIPSVYTLRFHRTTRMRRRPDGTAHDESRA